MFRVLPCVAALALAGCGGNAEVHSPAPDPVAAKGGEDAQPLLFAGKYAEAQPLFEAAVADPKQSGEAKGPSYAGLAACKALAGDLAGAKADLDLADQAGFRGAAYSLAHGAILLKSGDQAGAAKAFAAVRRGDSSVKIPDLK